MNSKITTFDLTIYDKYHVDTKTKSSLKSELLFIIKILDLSFSRSNQVQSRTSYKPTDLSFIIRMIC
jgi:hypothetical protein